MLNGESAESESLPPRDHAGCVIVAARAGCGMAVLQILMALAILLAALFSLILFR
ncbi:MAG TPA: hypothetical protein VFZ24_08095 [Longimicrobiales bacterium]